jgi:hypothetical protein
MNTQKINYVFGRGNWFESVIVGIVISIVLIIAGLIFIVFSPIAFLVGLFGFIRRKYSNIDLPKIL